MDLTLTITWWTCSACGVEAELPAHETVGFLVACPDCAGDMVELRIWDVAVPAPALLRQAA